MVGTVSETDRKIIRHLDHAIKPVIIPNGAGEDMITDVLEKKDLKNPVVLFQGNFFWLQNTEAAYYLIRKILPLAKTALPKVRFVIAGQNAANKIGRIKQNNLEIIDIAPDQNQEVRKIYQKASLFIAPIFGPGGTRLKILAAMAAGIPVVSTKTGVTGLTVKDKSEVLIANNPKEFIQSLQTIIKNKRLYEKIRRNAFALIEKKYNWKTISGNLEAVYKKIVKYSI